MNIVGITGRMAADPELKKTKEGTSVTAFTVAVDRVYTPKGKDRQADFIDVVAWREKAEFICRHFGKGKMIEVTGTIQTRNYEDRDGNKRKAVEVVAANVGFCGDREKKENGEQKPIEPEQFFDTGYDLPF